MFSNLAVHVWFLLWKDQQLSCLTVCLRFTVCQIGLKQDIEVYMIIFFISGCNRDMWKELRIVINHTQFLHFTCVRGRWRIFVVMDILILKDCEPQRSYSPSVRPCENLTKKEKLWLSFSAVHVIVFKTYFAKAKTETVLPSFIKSVPVTSCVNSVNSAKVLGSIPW